MTATKKADEKPKKVMVPRKKLQNVPDLLINGDEEVSASESTMSKILWMAFLIAMFYISFEIFIRLSDEAGGGKAEL